MSGKQKILWIDEETSGLNKEEHAILSLSALMEIDGKIVDEINLTMQPFKGDKISQEALDINGFTIEQIRTFDHPEVAFKKLIKFFSKYINRYDKNDKFSLAGYNIVKFDIPFLEMLFKKCNDPYLGSWINGEPLDVYQFVLIMKKLGVIKSESTKLEMIAQDLQIPIMAHDAKEDILATRKVYYKLLDKIEIKK